MRSMFLRTALAAAIATSVALTSSAQTIGCEVGGTGGPLPSSGTGGGGTFPTTLPTFPSVYTLNVASIPPGATVVTEVKLNGFTHTWTNDVQFVLTDPSGATHNILCRAPGSCDFNGNYSIQAACTGGSAWPTTCVNPVPPGARDQYFGTWPSGTNSILNTPLDSIAAATGAWTLTGYDWVGSDAGNLTSWDLCFGTPLVPSAPTAAPTLTAPTNGANVYGPYINLTWGAVGCATSYEVDVDGTVYATASNSYVFASTAGVHTWTARGLNASGSGPWAVARTFTDNGLATPTLSSPANGASLFGPTVNMTWVAVANASGYDVDVDGTVYAAATNSYAFASTAGGHTWTVRAKWNANTLIGPYATARTFTDLGLPPTPCTGSSLSTVFLGGNGLSSGSCVFFDVDVTNPAGITMSQLDQNTTSSAGTAFTETIYTRAGTSVGFEQTNVGWTNVASGAGFAAGSGQPSLVEFPDFTLAPGITGFCLVITGVQNTYTNGNGANQFFSNADLSITLGKSQSVPFSATSTPISPRVWNGTLRYNCFTGPTAYCTPTSPGTTNSCVPTIAGNNNPDVAHSNSCVVTVSSVEGGQNGLIFYGVNGTSASPWCASGNNSFLCVKAPLERGPVQATGGAFGSCSGSLVMDWNAFQLANPSGMGNPWSVGDNAWLQGWFRDPPACKTSFLSEALVLTYQ